MIDTISIPMRRSADMNTPSFLQRTLRWLSARLRYWLTIETAALELWAAVDSLLLGLFLMLPVRTFESSPTFTFMGEVAPEETWGVVMVAAGCLQIAGLNGVNHRLREIMALALAIIWAIWAIGLISSNAASTGTITYPMLTLAMMWSYTSNVVRANARKLRPDYD
jgi:hypothetical protein